MSLLSKSLSALSAFFAVKKSALDPAVWLRGVKARAVGSPSPLGRGEGRGEGSLPSLGFSDLGLWTVDCGPWTVD